MGKFLGKLVLDCHGRSFGFSEVDSLLIHRAIQDIPVHETKPRSMESVPRITLQMNQILCPRQIFRKTRTVTVPERSPRVSHNFRV